MKRHRSREMEFSMTQEEVTNDVTWEDEPTDYNPSGEGRHSDMDESSPPTKRAFGIALDPNTINRSISKQFSLRGLTSKRKKINRKDQAIRALKRLTVNETPTSVITVDTGSASRTLRSGSDVSTNYSSVNNTESKENSCSNLNNSVSFTQDVEDCFLNFSEEDLKRIDDAISTQLEQSETVKLQTTSIHNTERNKNSGKDLNEFEYLISPEELALIEAMEAEAYSQKPANKIVRSTTSPIYTRISPITSRSFSQYASNKPVQPINRDSAAINSNQAVFNNSDRHYSMQRTHSAVAEACITSTPSRSPYKNYLYTQTGSQPLLTQTACGTATSNKLFSPVLLNQSTKRGVESFVPCMRLTALSIDDDEFCFLKIVKARQVNGINFSKKKAQLDANSSSSSINNYLTSDATELTVILSQEWYHTIIHPGDVFHLVDLEMNDVENGISIFPTDTSQPIILNNDQGIIIMHPDIMISPTRIAESCSCVRRGVLTERFKSFGGTSAAAVIGNVKHAFVEAIMEKVLNSSASSVVSRDHVRSILTVDVVKNLVSTSKKEYLQQLFAEEITDEKIELELRNLINPLCDWLILMSAIGIDSCESSTSNSYTTQATSSSAKEKYKLISVESTEETSSSVILGIRGQLDLVARAQLRVVKTSSQEMRSFESLQELLLPVELKTGKWKPSTVISHRAQVMLYILLLRIRERCSLHAIEKKENISPKHGLIIYFGDQQPKIDLIKPNWTEIRALLFSRNTLAGAISISNRNESMPLPSVIRSERDCQYCYQAAQCMVFHAAVEAGTENSSGISQQFRYILRGIKPSHLKYFKLWDRLLDLESIATESIDRIKWSVSAEQLEDADVASIGRLRVTQCDRKIEDGKQIVILTLQRLSNSSHPLTESESDDSMKTLVESDRVHISVEGDDRCFAPESLDSKVNTSYSHSSKVGSSSYVVDLEDLQTSAISRNSANTFVRKNRYHSFTKPSKIIMTTEAAVATGNVLSVGPTSITVKLGKVSKRMFSFYPEMRIGESICSSVTVKHSSNNWSIRLDKDTASINISTMRSSIMTLFTPAYEPKEYKSFLESEGRSAPIKHSTITLARQRSLIVDLEEPLFKWADLTRSSDELYNLMAPSKISFESYQKYLTVFEEYRSSHRDLHNSSQDVIIGKDGEYIVGGELVVYKGCFPTQLYMKYLKLNKGQQEAIQSVLAAQDYSLLQGLPGTGKSSTIALAIRILIARGQSVLLTSYTHSAVDNLLFKLIEEGMFKRQIIRLGSHYIDHALKDFTLCSSDESNLESDSNISVIARRCEAARLIVCTVLTASRSPLMNKVRTDYCIVDEAGQITQPAVIGAIVQAKVFVLIGDDRQLPPLVISKEAEQKGMGISLLARLVIAHPSVVKYLTAQYRMNSDIMLVSNSIFYSDAMSCANDRVAHAKLQIPRFPEFIVTKQLAINSWLYKTLDPNNSVVYLDMDSINQRTVNKNVTTSENSSSSVTNSAEAQLVKLIVDSLVNCGLPISNIAVISPFRAQVRAITEELHQNCDSLGGTNSHAVNCEVSTIDRFQGKDKDVMIVSTVRSVIGSTIDAGNLLKDSKRINVAVTRAKVKLIILGSFTLLESTPALLQLQQLLIARKWMVPVPMDGMNLVDSFSKHQGKDRSHC